MRAYKVATHVGKVDGRFSASSEKDVEESDGECIHGVILIF
jgi:hypothetical protein